MNTRTGRVPLQWHMSACGARTLALIPGPTSYYLGGLGQVPFFICASVCICAPAPAPWMMASPTQKPKRDTEI